MNKEKLLFILAYVLVALIIIAALYLLIGGLS